ncbi:hypothetical protein Rahaq2_2679 [Rahnella aquatilis CIP 78.65 = ATCC 33071]|uniref:Uncharacterized protein n=1 Tax=Rahnella aquatilis (strain ATCC 33071 / DSM 4594 / JCM 1683 / NBRC 105701 / NCIMB 13365 / CIP 78.65) TaxID=745277 RepID=H2IRM2_RAHAC|nr:hypothetical protein Rahaq2_2679 [Rahnella aquatilis CIP 78.65 = ATCC 33071]
MQYLYNEKSLCLPVMAANWLCALDSQFARLTRRTG